MKPKRTLSGYMLLVGMMGLSIVGGALIFGIYSALVKTQVTSETKEVIKPLEGEINVDLLNKLNNRRQFSSSELEVVITQSPTPTPFNQPTPTLTVTPTAAVSPVASASAQTPASPSGTIR